MTVRDMARHLSALRDLLGRALTTSAYQGAFQAGPDDVDRLLDDFAALPTVHKEQLIEAVTPADPFGGRLAVDRSELSRIFVAPGPIYTPFTAADIDAMADTYAWGYAICGLGAGDLVDQTSMYNWVLAATVLDAGLHRLGCAIVPGGPGQTDRHVDALAALGATGIVGFPSFIEHILERAADRGVALRLRSAAVMGELQDTDAKQRVRQRYGVAMRQFYATTEVGVVAAECVAGQGLHLNSDLLVEFLEPHTGQPAEPRPGAPAELVITEFARRAMPMVRYASGDLIDTVWYDPCFCGLVTPRIGSIVGRVGEITKIKGMFLVPAALGGVLARYGIGADFQVRVDREPGGQDVVALAIAAPAPPAPDQLAAEVYAEARMSLELLWNAELPPSCPRLVDSRPAPTASGRL